MENRMKKNKRRGKGVEEPEEEKSLVRDKGSRG